MTIADLTSINESDTSLNDTPNGATMMIEERRNKQRITFISRAKTVSRIVFWNADTLTVRLIMANASILWALALVVDPTTFMRHGYEIMKTYGNEYEWAAAFFLHGIGVYWRLFDIKARPTWALIINAWGLGVWLLSTLAINLAIKTLPASACLEWVLCFFSAWALYKTGLKGEVVTP